MADEIAIQMLSFIRVNQGCKLKQIQEMLPETFREPKIQVGHPILKPINQLMDWRLIKALDWRNRDISKGKLAEALSPASRFFLSPVGLDIEDAFGVILGNKIHSVFGNPIIAPDFPPVFVLMPFAPVLQSVYETIENAVKEHNLTCKRADNFHVARSIVAEIWSAISNARLIIADCTGKNPNVFYEIGIAHALAKNTILLAQSIEDIPFDLKTIRFIIYSMENDDEKKKFQNSLSKAIKAVTG